MFPAARIMHRFAFLIIALATYAQCIRNGNVNAVATDATIMRTGKSTIFFPSSPTIDSTSHPGIQPNVDYPPQITPEARQSASEFHPSPNTIEFTSADASYVNYNYNEGGSTETEGNGRFSFPENRPQSSKYQFNANNLNEIPRPQSTSSFRYGNAYANNNNNNNKHNINEQPQQPEAVKYFSEVPPSHASIDGYIPHRAPSGPTYYRQQYPPFTHPNAIGVFNRESLPPYNRPQTPAAYYKKPNYFLAQGQTSPANNNYANTYGNHVNGGYTPGHRLQPNHHRRATPPPRTQPYGDEDFPPAYRPLPPPPQEAPQSQFPEGLTSLLSYIGSSFGQPPSSSSEPSSYPSQFGNFMIPLFGGSGAGSASSSLGSFLSSFGGGGAKGDASMAATQLPARMQIIKGLENIARNDNLQCVPKVLCQTIGSSSRRGQLPDFLTSPTITSFIAALPVSSPALIYGRAALLGISGGDRSCSQTYAKCPKTEDEILYYLNNHRGGFFKLFSGPDEETQHHQDAPQSQQQLQLPSVFNFLTGLTTNGGASMGQETAPTLGGGIAQGIGNFFGNMLSSYLGGQRVESRKKRKKRNVELDFEEFDEEKKVDNPQPGDVEGRILHQGHIHALDENEIKFFPPADIDSVSRFRLYRDGLLKFPASTRFTTHDYDSRKEDYIDYRRGKRINFIDEDNQPGHSNREKRVNFASENHSENFEQKLPLFPRTSLYDRGQMIFPDRTGTGKLEFDVDGKIVLRSGKILNSPSHSNGNIRNDEDRFTRYNSTRRPYQQAWSGNHNYYSGINYHRESRYQTTRATPTREDDLNVYVTNSKGIVDHYITPKGQKIYV